MNMKALAQRTTRRRVAAKEKALFFVLIALFRILLDLSYKDVIVRFFGYTGFKSNVTQLSFPISWILLAVLSLLIWKFYVNRDEKLSYEVLYLVFLISSIPFSSMVAFGAVDQSFSLAFSVYSFLLFVICGYLNVKRHYKLTLNTSRPLGDAQLRIIAIVFAIVVLFISAKYAHFRFNLSLANVYELRSEASTYNLPSLLAYAFSWTRTINSILIAYFIRKKQVVWAITASFIQLLCFSIDGLKGTLFLLILAITIGLLPKMEVWVVNKVALFGITGLTGLSYLIFRVSGDYTVLSMFVRRVMYVPVGISANYYDFFSTNTPDYFRQSFLRLLGFQSPYPSISYYISQVYEGTTSNSNNGLIADAMTNLGYVGIVIFPILICIVLRLLDHSAKGLDLRVYFTVGIYAAMELTNTFLMRILVTHGLIIAIIVLRFMDRERVSYIKVTNSGGKNEDMSCDERSPRRGRANL